MYSDTLDRVIDELEVSRGAQDGRGQGGDPSRRAFLADSDRDDFLRARPFPAFWDHITRRAGIMPSTSSLPTDEARESFWVRLFASPRFAAAVSLCTLALVAGLGVRLMRVDSALQIVGAPTISPTELARDDERMFAPWLEDGLIPGVRSKGAGESPAARLGINRPIEEPVGVRFFVRHEAGAIPGLPGAAYADGDQIRFTYWSGDNDYLLLFSIEDTGAVSVYYPDEEGGERALASVPIARGRNLPLEGSVELNNYVGHERFFVLFSPVALSVPHVRTVAQTALDEVKQNGGDVRNLDRLPVATPQATFWIEKR